MVISRKSKTQTVNSSSLRGVKEKEFYFSPSLQVFKGHVHVLLLQFRTSYAYNLRNQISYVKTCKIM